ncbi:hypothetical protein [Allobaculum sp. Allo2]|nr:hypothetical protein [Allobaculum sp. Allo2]
MLQAHPDDFELVGISAGKIKPHLKAFSRSFHL